MALNVNNYAILQGFRLNFYLNKPNRNNWGVVYARFNVGGDMHRISTGIKVKGEYWNKEGGGAVILQRDSMSRVNWEIHHNLSGALNNLYNSVNEKIEYYLCDTNINLTSSSIAEELEDIIRPKRMTKKNSKLSLSNLFKGLALEYDNKKTGQTLLGVISTFSRFMEEKGIKDNVESLNMATAKEWRNWLAEGDFSVDRAKCCLNYFFTLAKRLEQRYDYDFKLNKDRIEPIKDKRSVEERRDNGIALTGEEIERLRSVDLSGRKDLIPVRDSFLLQCWCGCRVEDMPLLLNSGNIKEDKDGVIFSQFTTKKKGITAIIPLNSLFPGALELAERYKDNAPFDDSNTALYNERLKELAELAGLKREITYTGQKGGVKYIDKDPLHKVISSHTGRHTFITNCIREKGLTPDKVKLMSGHADTRIIESVYANLTKEDNKNLLKKAINESQGRESRENESRKETRIPGNNNPADFALWLIRELGIKVESGELSLPGLVERIAQEKTRIIKKYGKKRYEDIKTFLGVGLGKVDKKRLEILFCKGLGKEIKLTGGVSGLRRL